MYPTGRQYIVCVPGIIENSSAVPSTGGKCVECDSISFRYMYKLIDVLATAADPGFPIGGTNPLGVLTSDAGTFQWKHVQKQKNWALFGGGHMPAASLDLPLDQHVP